MPCPLHPDSPRYRTDACLECRRARSREYARRRAKGAVCVTVRTPSLCLCGRPCPVGEWFCSGACREGCKTIAIGRIAAVLFGGKVALR
jgi:hypothetical protein